VKKSSSSSSPSSIQPEAFYETVLLQMPSGSVSLSSVRFNLNVALQYVLGWIRSKGTVVVNGCVEDSATAEISRAQLWQWLHHRVPLEGTTGSLTPQLIEKKLQELMQKLQLESDYPKASIVAASNLVFQLVTTSEPPSFITTFLLEKEPLLQFLR
jgi:malate synthase